MFNIEIIHFLQQFDHPIIHWFMVIVSAMGTTLVVLPFVLAITFGVDFKKGLVLVNVVAWVAIMTFILKDQINYPRPVDIDPSVRTVYFENTATDLIHIHPQEFLETFSPELLEQTRNDQFDRFGFPSGHTSIQVALWITLYFLFRKKRIIIFGTFFVLSTMMSRLYLAHHFLADVIGGSLMGIVLTALLLFLVFKTRYLTTISHQFKSLSILWLPAFLIPLVSLTPVWILGSLIGLNVASILVILQRNFPVFHVIPWKRVATIAVTLLFISSAYFFNSLIEQINRSGIELAIITLVNIGIVWGSLTLCNRLNLIRFRF